MKHTKKRRSRSKRNNHNEIGEETRALTALMEAFSLMAIEEASSAYREANGDVNKAAEILTAMLAESSDDPSGRSTTSEYPSTSSSITGNSFVASSSDGLMEEINDEVCRKGFNRGCKGKKVVAATGTVSTVLGKDYVMSNQKKDSMKSKEFENGHDVKDRDKSEQFLCSMLGDECELSLAVIRDVYCNCGCDIEKALNVLLDLCASSHELSRDVRSFNNLENGKGDTRLDFNYAANLADRASDSTSHSSESEVDNVQYMGFPMRSYSDVVANDKPCGSTSTTSSGRKRTGTNTPQMVLDSLFNVSESSNHDPRAMNWRNVVKKMKSIGETFVFDELEENNYAEEDEYHMLRECANQYWESRTSYFRKAATAYSNGQRGHAAYLSDQAKKQTKMAREADDKASQQIFKARNKRIENVITLDMHGQHVKQAMRLLKLHLLFGTYVSSIRIIRVITGCGSRKLKHAVTKLVEREKMKWSQENAGAIIIKLDGQRRDFNFLNTDNDSDTND